jgi:hypothetical protein
MQERQFDVALLGNDMSEARVYDRLRLPRVTGVAARGKIRVDACLEGGPQTQVWDDSTRVNSENLVPPCGELPSESRQRCRYVAGDAVCLRRRLLRKDWADSQQREFA